jgi:Tol biopolymer transport system component
MTPFGVWQRRSRGSIHESSQRQKERQMRMRTLLTALAGIAALVALTAVPTGASPRAVNGQIAYDRADPASPDDRFAYTANPDGTHEQQLVPDHTCCPSWSHDGSRLAIPYVTDDGRVGAAIVNADGSGYTPLTIDDPTLNLGCGPWSPDDARLACESWDESNPARGGIYTMSSSDGSGLTRLTNPLGGDDQPGAYSPDGTRLVFLRLDQDGNSLGLFVVKVKDGQLRRITPSGTLIQGGNPGDWSPQGNEIIFSRHVTADVRGSIWVVHADGSGLHEIEIQGLACGGSVFDPNGFGCHGVRWSPDGKKIIFAVNSPATHGNIYTANADGSGLAQVTYDGEDDGPAWGTHPPVN